MFSINSRRCKLYHLDSINFHVIRKDLLTSNSLSLKKQKPISLNNSYSLLKMKDLFKLLRSQLLKLPSGFKEQSIKVVKTCSEQCEFVVAHRIRRSQQILSLYTKWWCNGKLKIVVKKLSQQILKGTNCFVFSFIPFFNWDSERIRDTEISRLQGEIERVKQFPQNTGESTQDTNESNNDSSDWNKFCTCNRCKNDADDGWNLLYKNEYLTIWRKENVDHKGEGLYVYKVYGHFEDITASDFFKVQIDVDYRKEWDSNSVNLNIVDADTQTNSHILYWEFKFPSMFYNRDYVCNRRFTIDEENKMMIIINESANHPLCPENPPVYRVKEYWSHVVIKAIEDFDKPGVEFAITYFDNIGLIVPSYVTSWYTLTGMPEYIMQQKNAASNLAKRRQNENLTQLTNYTEGVPKIKKEENIQTSKTENNDYLHLYSQIKSFF